MWASLIESRLDMFHTSKIISWLVKQLYIHFIFFAYSYNKETNLCVCWYPVRCFTVIVALLYPLFKPLKNKINLSVNNMHTIKKERNQLESLFLPACHKTWNNFINRQQTQVLQVVQFGFGSHSFYKIMFALIFSGTMNNWTTVFGMQNQSKHLLLTVKWKLFSRNQSNNQANK